MHYHEQVDVLTIVDSLSGACIDCSDCVSGKDCPELSDWIQQDLAKIHDLFERLGGETESYSIANRLRDEQLGA